MKLSDHEKKNIWKWVQDNAKSLAKFGPTEIAARANDALKTPPARRYSPAQARDAMNLYELPYKKKTKKTIPSQSGDPYTSTEQIRALAKQLRHACRIYNIKLTDEFEKAFPRQSVLPLGEE